MISFMKDLIGATSDILRWICYFLAGAFIVTAFMYILKWSIEWILVPLLT